MNTNDKTTSSRKSNGRRAAKWIVVGLASAVAVGSAIVVYQNRRPPVANTYYVALGSSFASGLGLGVRAPGSPLVSGRTINGYPQQLARLLKVPTFTDMSSAGSTISHVLHGGQLGMGPQIDALGPDTRLVTLTSGGNDVNYIGDLDAMARTNRGGVTGSIVSLFWKGAKPVSDRNFAFLRTNMELTIREIRRRSPRAKVVVVTYPEIVPGESKCEALGITTEQANLMGAVGRKLADVTRAAVESAGGILVDVASLSIGHDACSAAPWVNGARPLQGAAFHPTFAGAHATAAAIADVLTKTP